MAVDKVLERKLSKLREKIRKLDGALVAFSGGVDSSFLMRICREELGEKAVAVTALSENYPKSELSVARRVAKIIGVKHVVLEPDKPCQDMQYLRPGMWRGSNLYSCLKSIAMRMKLKNVLIGSHCDDAVEQGQNFMAAKRAGVRSPLLESDLSKAEIRLLAKELGLPNWDKPSSALARSPIVRRKDVSRPIEVAKLYVRSICPSARIRTSGKKIFIAVEEAVLVKLARQLDHIQKKLKSIGFSEVVVKLVS